MHRNIKKEMLAAKKISITVIVFGGFLALISGILFVNRDVLHIFPRMDIAWIGFSQCPLFYSSAVYSYCSSQVKVRTWIDETDEMEIEISGKISIVGYAIQTILLGIAFFLLTFTGYLNMVSGFSIIAVILISGVASCIYGLYLRRHYANK